MFLMYPSCLILEFQKNIPINEGLVSKFQLIHKVYNFDFHLNIIFFQTGLEEVFRLKLHYFSNIFVILLLYFCPI